MNDLQQNSVILIVGDVDNWLALGRQLPEDLHIFYCEFADIDAALLQNRNPRFILTPLVSENFDLVDLAVLLHRKGYSGALRALIPELPDPQSILKEILDLCPGLDIDLIQITMAPAPAFH